MSKIDIYNGRIQWFAFRSTGMHAFAYHKFPIVRLKVVVHKSTIQGGRSLDTLDPSGHFAFGHV